MSDDPDSEIEFNLQRQAEEESPRRVDQEENALLDQDDINIGINGDAHGDHIGIRGNENYGSPNAYVIPMCVAVYPNINIILIK